jgi:hypothetical protein
MRWLVGSGGHPALSQERPRHGDDLGSSARWAECDEIVSDDGLGEGAISVVHRLKMQSMST